MDTSLIIAGIVLFCVASFLLKSAKAIVKLVAIGMLLLGAYQLLQSWGIF